MGITQALAVAVAAQSLLPLDPMALLLAEVAPLVRIMVLPFRLQVAEQVADQLDLLGQVALLGAVQLDPRVVLLQVAEVAVVHLVEDQLHSPVVAEAEPVL